MLLASYRGPSLPVADAMAFAQPEEQPILGSGAVAALKRLTQAAAAEERILMAFDVAEPGRRIDVARSSGDVSPRLIPRHAHRHMR